MARHRTRKAAKKSRARAGVSIVPCTSSARLVSHKSVVYADAWVMLCILYVAYAIPLRLGFDVPVQGPGSGIKISGWFWVDIVADATFICDFVLNFVTGYYDYSGTLRYTRKDIAINYTGGLFLGTRARGTWLPERNESKYYFIPLGWLFGWCFWDFLSSIPTLFTYMVLIVLGTNTEDTAADDTKAFRVIRLVRLAKLLRLGRAYPTVLSQPLSLRPSLALFAGR